MRTNIRAISPTETDTKPPVCCVDLGGVMISRRLRWYSRIGILVVPATVALGFTGGSAWADFSGGAAALTRAPYLSDLTSSSVQVSWATTTQNRGVVRYGAPGNCTANSLTPSAIGNPITVNGVTEYRNSVAVA